MTSRVARQGAREVYRGYMPVDLPQHRPPNRIKPWWKVVGKPRVTLYPKKRIEGFSEQPEYPPLNDGSRSGIKTQVRLDWYEKIKNLPTVEQKLYEICSQQNQRLAIIGNSLSTFNPQPMAQYLTQTAMVEGLPSPQPAVLTENIEDRPSSRNDQYQIDKLRDIILNQIAVDLHDSIKTSPPFEVMPSSDLQKDFFMAHKSIQNLIYSAKRYLAGDNPQLLEYNYDLSPSLKSWWFHSKLPPPNNKPFYWSRKDVNGHINQIIQVNGSSVMNIRSSDSLEPVLSFEDQLVTDLNTVPNCPYNLTDYGAKFRFRKTTTLPGFWYNSDSTNDFPHTCFLTLKTPNERKKNYSLELIADDGESCANGQAILMAFSWLNSLSMHHGYTPYQELDYPLTCQVISTDGQNWLFNVYQLNGHMFHRDLGGASRNNVCWSSGILKLFDNYENGQFNGVNDDVIRHLYDFLTRKTSSNYTESLKLKPLLGQDLRTDDEKELMKKSIRRYFENRVNYWSMAKWRVPMFEHIFFRSKVSRRSIKHMKPEWHPPKPPISKYFD